MCVCVCVCFFDFTRFWSFLIKHVIFIYGNEFKEISKYYFLIAPSIILLSYTYIFYSYFSSIGRQDIFLTYISISFLVYIIAFLLIYKFLFEYSIFLSFMLSSFFLTIFLLKKLFDINKLKYDQIILNSRDIKLFIKISKRYAKKIL